MTCCCSSSFGTSSLLRSASQTKEGRLGEKCRRFWPKANASCRADRPHPAFAGSLRTSTRWGILGHYPPRAERRVFPREFPVSPPALRGGYNAAELFEFGSKGGKRP